LGPFFFPMRGFTNECGWRMDTRQSEEDWLQRNKMGDRAVTMSGN
jgi:hypothetical protein